MYELHVLKMEKNVNQSNLVKKKGIKNYSVKSTGCTRIPGD